MSNLDINPIGSALLLENESYLQDLSEERAEIYGGITPPVASLTCGPVLLSIATDAYNYGHNIGNDLGREIYRLLH